MTRIVGIGVSPGVAVGRAVVLTFRTQVLRFSIPTRRVEQECARLEDARQASRAQLEVIKTTLAGGPGRELVTLFDAQILMLDDPMWRGRAEALIREQRVNAEWAVQHAFDELARVFDDVADPYLRERQGDFSDVVGRIRSNLRQGASGPEAVFRQFEEPCVLVADELTPSMAAQLDWSLIRGFATDAGSRTYHTAILARSLGVPAVVGLHDVSARVTPGALVAIDGSEGSVVLDPPPGLASEAPAAAVGVGGPAPAETRTRDGVCVRLDANVELPADVAAALDYEADGIGLYRSEFLLADRSRSALTEDEQYAVYRDMVARMSPRAVTVRTFDIDEDQLERRQREDGGTGAWAEPAERGGVRLGARGIRLTLKRRGLLDQQLRALLRAAAHGDLRIMFPFVSGVEELRQAKAVLADAAADLAGRGIRIGPVRVGVMIEVPAAAFTADLLAREADFLTIGTNDLIQCCLAVDRTDDRVSDLYAPLHPAILRLVRRVVRAARRWERPLSVCGEMASEPAHLALLVGLGLTSFSMAPSVIPQARRIVSEVDAGELRRLAACVLGLSSVAEIEACLAEALAERLGRAQPVPAAGS